MYSRSTDLREHQDHAAIATQWWLMPQSTRQLRALANAWCRECPPDALSDLGNRMYEVYAARQGLQPYPDVAVAFIDETPAGILSGHEDQLREQFYIHGTAIHPAWRGTAWEPRLLAALVEAAIDVSLARGWRGWVAYDAEDAPGQDLLDLGFTASHPFYYRKMGYFS